jgi:hypothetical protein
MNYSDGHENLVSWLMMLGLLSIFVAYEFVMLRAVSRAIQRVRQLANWIWLSNTLLETLLPGLAVAFLSSASSDPICLYRPLANPAGLAFLCLSAFPRSA